MEILVNFDHKIKYGDKLPKSGIYRVREMECLDQHIMIAGFLIA